MVRENDSFKKSYASKNRAKPLLLEWNKVIRKLELLSWRSATIFGGI